MRALAVLLQYDGTHFAGWQYQLGQRTVQGEVEHALESITGEAVKVQAAGRTDAGVHAAGQVISFRTGGTVPVERVPVALNTHLPGDLRALAAQATGPDFHATRSALGKTYTYAWWTSPTCGPFLSRYVHHLPAELDLPAMQAAGRQLEGNHNFKAFSSVGSSARTFRRTVRAVAVERSGCLTAFTITADGFLYHMVRIIAGTLIEVGMGRRPVDGCFAPALHSGQRRLLGPTAPAHGLWLVQVEYPPPVGILQDPYSSLGGLSALTGRLALY
ncbi:MAG TPA: tRNA pseudouridine(38-40) synthase TruA [Clostridiales bacterium UBA8153]|nr:tRNA pseudouridine(38-40) synthase TruA [Clostridiales bacterium UBA8153]